MVLGQQEHTRPKGWQYAEYDMAVASKDETYRPWIQRKHMRVWRSIELKGGRL